MKTKLLALLLLLACGLFAQRAVLVVGSDWCEASPGLQAVWESPAFREAAGIPLETVDQPDVVTDAVRTQWEKQKAFRLELANLPGLAYFDNKGRCVMLTEGLKAQTGEAAAQTLRRLLAKGKHRAAEIAALLAKNTPEAAGQALARVAPELGLRRAREPIALKAAWECLTKQDPEDQTGWRFALEFDPAGKPADAVRAFRDKRDTAGFEAYYAQLDAKPKAHLSINQRQGLKLLRYAFYRHDRARAAEMTALLREVLSMGADTHFGKAAQGLLCLAGEGPVSIPYGWFPKDARPGNQTWRLTIGTAKTLTAPGTYALTLRRQKGQGALRVQALRVDGRPAPLPQTRLTPGASADLPFTFPAGAKPILELDVAFDAPKDERGALSLREILPPRTADKHHPIEPEAAPWSFRKGECEVKAYARAVLPEPTLRAIAAQPGGTAFLKAFFSDRDWMEAFFAAGDPSASWETAFRALDALAYYAAPLNSPLWRRAAAAAALNASDDPTETIRFFRALREQAAAKRLWRGFPTLRSDQLRFVFLPQQCPAESLRWLAARHHVPPRQYTGVCWSAPYRLYNFFGDSIHGRDYYPPWDHAYIRHEASRLVGGVCGALSYYGSAAAKAFGLPSTPGGQPGHCAYTLWSPQENRWLIAYNVGAYTGLHFSPWRGLSRFSIEDLAAEAFAAPGFLPSMRRLWRAEAQRLTAAPKTGWKGLERSVYAWEGTSLPQDPATLQRLERRPVNDFSLDFNDASDHLCYVWSGWLTLDRDAKLTLSLRSDDGARLWINGRPVAGKDGLHGLEGSTAALTLSRGEHPVELRYFNYNGGRGLELTLTPLSAYSPALDEAYRQAAQTAPLNLTLFRAWADFLSRAQNTPLQAWETFLNSAANGLHNHLEPAWELLASSALPALQRLGGKPALKDALLFLAKTLRQGPQRTAEFCNYTRILNEQAKLLGDAPEETFPLFQTALETQLGTPNAFGILLRWGGERFLAAPDTSRRMIAAIETLLQTRGNANQMLGQYLRETIREASEAGNAEAFHALCALQDSLVPRTRTPFTFPDFGAPRLSDRALLRTSSTSRWDHPETYHHILDGLSPTLTFHTSQEAAPWAEICLPGMAEISGVYLLNTPNNARRLAPFAIEVSEDNGKTWKQVAEETAVRSDYRLTFPPVKAQTLRIICRPKEGAKTFLHLRKIGVFGKKLY